MSRANAVLNATALMLLAAAGFGACQSTDRNFGSGAAGSAMAAGVGGDNDDPSAGRGGGGKGAAGGTDTGGTLGAPGGDAGATADAGAAGTGGDFPSAIVITEPTLAPGKTYLAYETTIGASGGESYTWSITSGTLPQGLTLEDEASADVTIAGTPTEAGLFPITLSVTDGSSSAELEVTLAIAHSVLFLSDRDVSGVSELFLAELGDSSAPTPVRLNASFPTGGGVSSYAWSPDGSKVLYLAKQSSSAVPELWVSALDAPGTAKRVSAAGVNVSLMAWLGQGNIAAYMTNTGSAYLVDLSGSTPGTSKLAVAASTTANALLPSPNGTSVTVSTFVDSAVYEERVATLTYVTWANGAPKSVTLQPGDSLNRELSYSYDGRLAVRLYNTFLSWWDLSLVTPSYADTNLGGVYNFSWSSRSQTLLYVWGAGQLTRGTFDGATLKTTELIPERVGSTVSWSPDGDNALFRTGEPSDLRGISDIATATANTDFSLLPSGFISAAANAIVALGDPGWSPDSNWIAVRADRDAKNQNDLHLLRWSTPGTAYRAHANTIASGITSSVFAPSSKAIAFVGTVSPQANAGLYLTTLPNNGAPPLAALVSDPPTSIVQNDVNWLPGSRVIAYRATVSGKAQLFALSVKADGTPGEVVPISGVSGSGVSSYQLAPLQ
jgi:Tol biopolymer transport system component